jgi:hypothetical protein
MPTSGNTIYPNPQEPETVLEASREAEQRPLDFPAKERAVYARAMIKRIQEFQRAGRPTEQIKELLPEFVAEYPHLFEMITQREGYDRQSLEAMLMLLDKIGAGTMNTHKASVIVGNHLVEKFVKPQLKGNPPSK